MISYVSAFFYTTATVPVVVPLVPVAPLVPVINNPSLPEGPITSLPPELFGTIFEDLNIPSLGKMSLVSKQWEDLSSKDIVWKKFENEYDEKTPHLKFKIKTSLKPIYQSIIKIIEKKNHEFYCKLAKTLFDGNIQIKKLPCADDLENRYEIILDKERQINFIHNDISSIFLSKKIHLLVGEMGFEFELRDSMKICSTHSTKYYYHDIFGGVDTLTISSWTKNVPMFFTSTKFLDTHVSTNFI